ncbi:MAG: ATPase [Lachnospiraceae bacterium]|nr:ATPase [Lachnospiraceae bacterium]
MEHLIHKISEIEAAASSILDGMDERKGEIAAQMREETVRFDAELEQETADRINQLHCQKEQELKEKQEQQKAKEEQILSKLDETYQQNHSSLAAQLFSRIIKE